VHEVHVDAVPLGRLSQLIETDRAVRLAAQAEQARELMKGRILWNVNATATGGGVAEMLQALLAYTRGARLDARWLVLDGNQEFFRLTKRIHNLLHGSPGDFGPLGEEQRPVYDSVLASNLKALSWVVQPGDVVLLHDPQTAGLVPGLADAGLHVVWRCHVGRDTTTDETDQAWSFLRPYIERAHAVVFSRVEYVPDWVDMDRCWMIPPSLDPFTAKNAELSPESVQATLLQTGLVDFPGDHGSLEFRRRDGSTGMVRQHLGLIAGDQRIPPDAELVLQVSRWDRLKDMPGVLTGFAAQLGSLHDSVHLMLAGPDVSGVSDDPEGSEVLAECLDLWRAQSPEVRERLHLCSLPMDDVDENAHMVNALQRHASVVVQKSLVEGFGLTVTEPMWKSRPVLASKVGGIQDQITDGRDGLLLQDPTDLGAFGSRLVGLVDDNDLRGRLGSSAHERIRDQFLGDRHLGQYVELLQWLIEETPKPSTA
jgi:trehalose synthase